VPERLRSILVLICGQRAYSLEISKDYANPMSRVVAISVGGWSLGLEREDIAGMRANR
jgi:hypothetical protein